MALAPLIPVLDLRRGQLVQARGGVRHLYEPLVCPLCSSTEPQALVQVLRERYGFRTFYLADLDALSGWALALPIYHRLAELGASLWVDAGLADMPTVQAVLDHEAERAIIALESLVQPEIVPTLIAAHGPNRIMFSLDLNEGRPITRIAEWQGQSAREIAERMIGLGIQEMLILDLAAMGLGRGPPALDLCRNLAERFPHVQLYVGGGVASPEHLEALADAGVAGALVATALYQGNLPATVVRPWSPTRRPPDRG